MEECPGCKVLRAKRVVPQWSCTGDGCTVLARMLELLTREEVKRLQTFIQCWCPDADGLLGLIDTRLAGTKTSSPTRAAVH